MKSLTSLQRIFFNYDLVFKNKKLPFDKTKTSQLALSYMGPTFLNETPDMHRCIKNLNTFKPNLKTYFLNKLETSNNSF